MYVQPTTLDRIGRAVKLPFSLFADEKDHVVKRLEEMHIHMPETLPQKRFFKH